MGTQDHLNLSPFLQKWKPKLWKRKAQQSTYAAAGMERRFKAKDEALRLTWYHPCITPPPGTSVRENCYCQSPPSPTSILSFFPKPEHCAELGVGQPVGRSVMVKLKVLERRSLETASSLWAREPGCWYTVPRCALSWLLACPLAQQ